MLFFPSYFSGASAVAPVLGILSVHRRRPEQPSGAAWADSEGIPVFCSEPEGIFQGKIQARAWPKDWKKEEGL
jgi:hypothetical protein